MALNDSASMHSSTSSYRQLEPSLYPQQLARLVQRNGLLAEGQDPPFGVSPIVRRNASHNPLPIRSPSPRTNEKNNTFHNKFYESGNDSGIYKSIANYAAREISLQTEKELLRKEVKRLKEEVGYLTEKSTELQRRNERLMRYKSRAEIFGREYQKLMSEFATLRQKYRKYECQYEPTHVPLSLQQINQIEERGSKGSHELKGKEVASRIMGSGGGFGGSKISWKKVTGGIRELAQKYPSVTPYDQLPLLESRVQSSNEDQSSLPSRPEARTIDIKDFQRSRLRQFQRKCQELEQELMETRRKNIDLYKKCEEFEGEKLKYLEAVTELKYERSRQNTAMKDREVIKEKDREKMVLEIDAYKIRVMELEEKIQSDQGVMRLLRLEKGELEGQLTSARKSLERVGGERNMQQEEKCKIIEKKYEKVAEQFNRLKAEMAELSRKSQETQIEVKLLQKELEEKKETISQLEQLTAREKVCRNEGLLEEQSNPSEQVVPVATKQSVPLGREEVNTLIHEIALLRSQNNNHFQQQQLLQSQVSGLKKENHFLSQNYAKLTRIFEHEKQENLRLGELRESWRQIQSKAKLMKRLDAAVEHLWQIKEVEYDNLHGILRTLRSGEEL